MKVSEESRKDEFGTSFLITVFAEYGARSEQNHPVMQAYGLIWFRPDSCFAQDNLKISGADALAGNTRSHPEHDG